MINITKVEVPNVSSWLEIGLAGCFFPLAARFTLDSHIFQHSIESLFNSGCWVQVDKFQTSNEYITNHGVPFKIFHSTILSCKSFGHTFSIQN